MNSRHFKSNKKVEHYNISIDTFIERIKKVRALNCGLSDIGIDSYLWKKAFSRIRLMP